MQEQCVNCGSTRGYEKTLPINDKLKQDWRISDSLARIFNRREGTKCLNCGINIRAQGLAYAILESKFGYGATNMVEWVKIANSKKLKVSELNSCHQLHNTLKNLKSLVYSEYGTESQQDIEQLTYNDNEFDIVLHSEVLEHVNSPSKAMDECRRVLKKDGIIFFTTPVLWSRKTIQRAKNFDDKIVYLLPKSFHGKGTDDYLVRYEFGRDIGNITKSRLLKNDWRNHNYVLGSGKSSTNIGRKELLVLCIQEFISKIRG